MAYLFSIHGQDSPSVLEAHRQDALRVLGEPDKQPLGWMPGEPLTSKLARACWLMHPLERDPAKRDQGLRLLIEAALGFIDLAGLDAVSEEYRRVVEAIRAGV